MKFVNLAFPAAVLASTGSAATPGETEYKTNQWTKFYCYRIEMNAIDLAELNAKPAVALTAPKNCEVTVFDGPDCNANTAKQLFKTNGAQCNYPFDSADPPACINKQTGEVDKTQTGCRTLSWKIDSQGQSVTTGNRPTFGGHSMLSLHGIEYDQSMIAEISSYKAMQDINRTVVPNAVQVNVFVNNDYAGIFNRVEEVDSDFFTERSMKGTVHKEWFKGHFEFNKVRDASNDCQQKKAACTKEEAEKALEALDKWSFINAFVVNKMAYQYTSVPFAVHYPSAVAPSYEGFNLHIGDDKKITFIPSDFTDALDYSMTDASKGYHELPEFGDNKKFDDDARPSIEIMADTDFCKAATPLYSSGSYLYYHACDEVLYTMARAWGDDYRKAFKRFFGPVTNGQDNILKTQKEYNLDLQDNVHRPKGGTNWIKKFGRPTEKDYGSAFNRKYILMHTVAGETLTKMESDTGEIKDYEYFPGTEPQTSSSTTAPTPTGSTAINIISSGILSTIS
eukprot:Pgem_evm1s17089